MPGSWAAPRLLLILNSCSGPMRLPSARHSRFEPLILTSLDSVSETSIEARETAAHTD